MSLTKKQAKMVHEIAGTLQRLKFSCVGVKYDSGDVYDYAAQALMWLIEDIEKLHKAFAAAHKYLERGK